MRSPSKPHPSLTRYGNGNIGKARCCDEKVVGRSPFAEQNTSWARTSNFRVPPTPSHPPTDRRQSAHLSWGSIWGWAGGIKPLLTRARANTAPYMGCWAESVEPILLTPKTISANRVSYGEGLLQSNQNKISHILAKYYTHPYKSMGPGIAFSFWFSVTNNLHHWALFQGASLFSWTFWSWLQCIGNHCEQSEQWELRVCQSNGNTIFCFSSSKVMKSVFNCSRLKIALVIRANAQIISVNFTASSGCYLILILIVITPQRELN